jgi:tetratricopeptide (TPR) repeat protein
MKRVLICLIILLWIPLTSARGEEALHYFNLGIESSMTRKKIAHFTKALELDPNMAMAYEKRGMLYYFQEEYDKMIQDFLAYLELEPATAETYNRLGMGYLKKGIYEPAIDVFTRAIAMEPNRADAYAYRAEAYRLSGMGEEAMRDANMAIKSRGDLRAKADAYRTRAKLYREMGRTKLANQDVKASYRIDPRVPRWWYYVMNYASPEEMRSVAPFLLIALAFVLIFGVRLKPPEKDD